MLLVKLAEKGFIPQREDLAESVEENKELTLKAAHELYEKTVRPTLKPSTAIAPAPGHCHFSVTERYTTRTTP